MNDDEMKGARGGLHSAVGEYIKVEKEEEAKLTITRVFILAILLSVIKQRKKVVLHSFSFFV